MNPGQVMVIGFLSMILIGATILNLPISTKSGQSIGFLDALFTATSAICVTGLVVVDTATYWSTFGQIVIITMIQIGGLGFMSITTMIAIIIKKRINLKERLLIQESLNQFNLSGLVKLTRYILLTTFLIEGIGALLLSLVFVPEFGFIKGIGYSIFHSISAFCNAGFDLMGTVSGEFSSITYFHENTLFILTISMLIILGGLGFPVILDIVKEKKYEKLNIHSKVVLVSTISLIAIGMVFILLLEYNNPETLANMSIKDIILSSFFQSVTTRTAGFNSIDLSLMRESTLFLMVMFMFIGSSPGSTGGGIKTTTIAVLILSVRSLIYGKEDVEIYNRRLATGVIRKSLAIFLIGVVISVLGTFIISITEPHFTLLEAGFEVVSSIATVGLSIGGSSTLSTAGKVFIITLMFMGRVGTLTIFMALASRNNRKKSIIRYPEGKIIVG
ncbi:MAG: TrkH family potassium uptake protein [Peptostreptococcaceae bacterium]